MKIYVLILLPLLLIGCAPALSKVDQDMFVAIKADNTQEVERLIASGANVNARNKQEHSLTPLGWAAVWGSNNAAEFLMAHGADINARDSSRGTPLHMAAYKGKKEPLSYSFVRVQMSMQETTEVGRRSIRHWKNSQPSILRKRHLHRESRQPAESWTSSLRRAQM